MQHSQCKSYWQSIANTRNVQFRFATVFLETILMNFLITFCDEIMNENTDSRGGKKQQKKAVTMLRLLI